MEEVIRYLAGCIAIGIFCMMLLAGIFIAVVIIARNDNKNDNKEEDRANAVANVRLAYCIGCINDEKTGRWFTAGKIYIAMGTHIMDDDGHDWDCFYINDKKPHIKRALGYQFYIV